MAVVLAGMPVVAGAMAGSVMEHASGGTIFSRARTLAA
jgi:photosystem II stability/assembly factor-like uncharacterized protein